VGSYNRCHALVTGGAGFIGSHLVEQLLTEGWQVTVVDNFDSFYDITFKERNIRTQLSQPNYRLVRADIRDLPAIRTALAEEYQVVIHLAAKAGVRPSIQDPVTCQQVNVQGTQNILELAKERGIKQFIFASSSSVYGLNPDVPWREDNHMLLPVSPYAATKIAGELIGHVYSNLYGIRFIALRFFTVFGPRQRPDLAIHKFARLMLEGKPLPVYGDGLTCRDYTYIDDIVQGIRAAIKYNKTNYEVFNLGNNCTVTLSDLIQALEEALGVEARLQRLPEQPGDVQRTYACIEKANRLLGYEPKTDITTGLKSFVQWIHNN